MDTRLYVMTHKEYVKPSDDMYISLHVGKALGNEFGYVGDDTGDNISLKNRNYCELTGMYWIWKNVSCDVVGICHYRRYFVKDEAFLTKEYVEKTLEQYDVIVPNSSFTTGSSVADHYKREHIWNDMAVTREVIAEKYPEYLCAFDHCMSCNLFSLGNMVVTRKDIYDKYMEWLFDILFEVEKRTDVSGYDTFQARLYGYLSERLFRVWLLNSSYKIREEEVRMIDPKDSDNATKAVDLKYRMVSIILRDTIAKYKSGSYGDLICSEAYDIDFEGKIPVWIFWAQGLDDAPDLVRVCVESIKRNIPADIASVRIVTMDNVGEYISIPEWIVERFEQGVINLTFFSDILRVGLLYRYGGMWLDATYFALKPIDRDMLLSDFYTLRLKQSKWKADVTKGQWSCNLFVCKPGNVLFRYILEAFYDYWRTQDKIVDYYLFDYIIATAYDNIPEVKAMIEACPYSNEHVHDLRDHLCEVYKAEKFGKLTEDTTFLKLSYKVPYCEENLVGKKTMYGYLKEI